MKILTLRHLLFAGALSAPILLGGCVVEPNSYYAQPAYYPDNEVVYSQPYYAPAYYGGPSVYVGTGCCWHGGGHYWHGGGGWHGGGWHH